MNKDEKIAKEYLETLSRDVIFHPDGDIPPDFKVGGVAVEVRRLNKNIRIKNGTAGLENSERRLYDALMNVFDMFESPIPEKNYRISLKFSRPIGKISNLKRKAREQLLRFLENRPETPYQIQLSNNVFLTISATNRKSNRVFYIGTLVDRDQPGWVGCDYIENINYCIAEKTKKMKKYKSRYAQWWLVLVDSLALGIVEPERSIVTQNVNKAPDWKKIIIIHPVSKKEILKIG